MRVLPAPRFVLVCRPSSLVWSPSPVHFNIYVLGSGNLPYKYSTYLCTECVTRQTRAYK